MNQPGGWTYSVLPFLEEGAIRAMGKGLIPAAKKAALARMQTQPAPTYVCPSRRGAIVGPIGDNQIWNVDTTISAVLGASRADYAGNGGTDKGTSLPGGGCCNGENGNGPGTGNGGPPSGSDSNGFDLIAYFPGRNYYKAATGVIYGGSQVGPRQIPDGLSRTYLFGEKALQPQHYNPAALPSNFRNVGDDQSMYQGYDYDTIRWAGDSVATPTPGTGANWQPLKDENHFNGSNPDGGWGTSNFGSVHPSGCFFVMCDGSVQSIAYTVDPAVHWKLANRKDGYQVSLP